MKRASTIFAAYWLIALATFAWSASDPAHACDGTEHQCFEDLDRATAGLTAGILWPLYWAWGAADAVRGQ